MKIKEKIRQSKQQAESKRFFNEKAKEWSDKAEGQIVNKVNVIKQRNDFVLEVLKQRPATKFLLDVGSGVGDLVCDAAKLGIKATGIDIAGGMVDLSHRRAIDNELELAEFILADYFDWHVEAESYDVVVANGFLEYISYQQRDEFFSDVFRILRPGGSVVVSARNRLFNIMSANDYTKDELVNGTTDKLIEETVALSSRTPISELLAMETAPLQPEEMQHANTGIGVACRYQYTPIQLMKIIAQQNYIIKGLGPIHIHAGPPSFKGNEPKAHFVIANLLQELATKNIDLIGSASAFMVHAMKAIG